jgi:hypothetical protein
MAVADLLARPFLTLFAAYASYLVGLVVYRLYFHPLAKFPGPKYAAISRWHEFYYEVVLKGKFTFKVQELHKQYGGLRILLHFPSVARL